VACHVLRNNRLREKEIEKFMTSAYDKVACGGRLVNKPMKCTRIKDERANIEPFGINRRREREREGGREQDFAFSVASMARETSRSTTIQIQARNTAVD
jgi:hypothetical protein